ncbi:MAG: hypothetical protein ACTSP5_00170 [Candidatus Heimdallarchaeota archaeon]
MPDSKILYQALDPNSDFGKEFRRVLYSLLVGGQNIHKNELDKTIEKLCEQTHKDTMNQFKAIAKAALSKSPTIENNLEPTFPMFTDVTKDLIYSFLLLQGQTPLDGSNSLRFNKFKRSRIYNSMADPFCADTKAMMNEVLLLSGRNDWREDRLIQQLENLGYNLPKEFSLVSFIKTLIKLRTQGLSKTIHNINLNPETGEFIGYSAHNERESFALLISSFFNLMMNSGYSTNSNPDDWLNYLQIFDPLLRATQNYLAPFRMKYSTSNDNKMTPNILDSYDSDLFFLKDITPEGLIYTILDLEKVKLARDFTYYLTEEELDIDRYIESSYSELFSNHLLRYYSSNTNIQSAKEPGFETPFTISYKVGREKFELPVFYNMYESILRIQNLLVLIKNHPNFDFDVKQLKSDIRTGEVYTKYNLPYLFSPKIANMDEFNEFKSQFLEHESVLDEKVANEIRQYINAIDGDLCDIDNINNYPTIFTLDNFLRHQLGASSLNWHKHFYNNFINQMGPFKNKLNGNGEMILSSSNTVLDNMGCVYLNPNTGELRIYVKVQGAKSTFKSELKTVTNKEIPQVMDLLVKTLANGKKVINLGIMSTESIYIPNGQKGWFTLIFNSLKEHLEEIREGQMSEYDAAYIQLQIYANDLARELYNEDDYNEILAEAEGDTKRLLHLLAANYDDMYTKVCDFSSLYETDGSENKKITQLLRKALKKLNSKTSDGETLSLWAQLNREVGNSDDSELIPGDVWSSSECDYIVNPSAEYKRLKLLRVGAEQFNNKIRQFSLGHIHLNDMPGTLGNSIADFVFSNQIYLGFSKELFGDSFQGLLLNIESILNNEDFNEKDKLERIQEIFSNYDLMINILGLQGIKEVPKHEQSMLLVAVALNFRYLTGMDICGVGGILGTTIPSLDDNKIKEMFAELVNNIENTKSLSTKEKAERIRNIQGVASRKLKYQIAGGFGKLINFIIKGKNSKPAKLINSLTSSAASVPGQAAMQMKTGISLDIGTAQVLLAETDGYDIYLRPLEAGKGGAVSSIAESDGGSSFITTIALLAFVTDYLEIPIKIQKLEIDIFEYINTFFVGMQLGIALITRNPSCMVDLSDPISLKTFIVDQFLPLDPEMDEGDYERRQHTRHFILRAPVDVFIKIAMTFIGASLMMLSSLIMTGSAGGFGMAVFQVLTSVITSLLASTMISTGFALIGKRIVYSGDLKPGKEGWKMYMDGQGLGDVWSWLSEPKKTFVSHIQGFFKGLRFFQATGRWYNPNQDTDSDGLIDKYELSMNIWNGYERKHIIRNLDWTNPDCDSDGIPDGVEAYGLFYNGTHWSENANDIDNAEQYISSDPMAWDSDKDGLSDMEEHDYGTHPGLNDTDSDGIVDGEEVYTFGSNPAMIDTDGDSIHDFDEINATNTDIYNEYGDYITNPADTDSDGDNIPDNYEIFGIEVPYSGIEYSWTNLIDGKWYVFTDPTNQDSDGDGLSDFVEVGLTWTNPRRNDTDLDGIGDYYECLNWNGTHGLNPRIPDDSTDTDQDGLVNMAEYIYGTYAWAPDSPLGVDFDHDGLLDGEDWNAILCDIDGDGLPDGYEFYDNYNGTAIDPETADADEDGIPNYLDDDSDNDGLSDGLEYQFGSSQNVADSDMDGIDDYDEVYGRFGYNTDPSTSDTDQDGLSDYSEIFGYTYTHRNGTVITVFTSPINPDMDYDGIPDGTEAMYPYRFDPTDATDGHADFDNDFATNAEEIMNYGSNPYDWDTDNDGLPDGWEEEYDLNSLRADFDRWAFSESSNISYIAIPGDGLIRYGATGDYDSDGLSNLFEYANGMKPNNLDSEDDGLPDIWEVTWGTNPILNDALADYDNDGYYVGETYRSFTNLNEFHAGTDPYSTDYDGDLLLDGFEYYYGLDPKSAVGNDGTYGDYDDDHVINLWEQEIHTNPNDAVLVDMDGDFIWDDWEIYYFSDIWSYNMDADVESDGLTNGFEWLYYCNPLTNDTDTDAITDYDEIYIYGTDPTGEDTDFDGLSDGLEIDFYGTNADFDGISDGDEHHIYGTHPGDPDSDNDLIDDFEEVNLGFDNYITDPNSPDTDQDTMPDKWEIDNAFDPTDAVDANNDPDSDGLINALEYITGSDPHDYDSDLDAIPDGWEYHNGLNPMEETDALADPDNDGSINYVEYSHGTDPQIPDCDYDGLDDSDEIYWGTDPWNSDCDDDNLTDSQEVLIYNSDPWLNDTDADNLSDYDEVMGTFGYVSDPTTTGNFWLCFRSHYY